MLSLSRSASTLSLVLLAAQLPVIAFTLLGGVAGDRYSRRLVMLTTDAGRAVVQAVTAGLLLSGHASVLALATLQACAGAGSALFVPAASGLVANLAPEGEVRQANSLLSMSRSVSGVLALAGASAGVRGQPGRRFAFDAVTFAASTLTLTLIRAPAFAEGFGRRRGLVHELGEGWRAVRQRPWLSTYVAHASLLNTLAGWELLVLGLGDDGKRQSEK